MHNKSLIKFSVIALILLFSFLPIIFSAYINIFNSQFYDYSFKKYDIQDKFKDVNMNDFNNQVLSYLTGKNDSMPSSIYLNEKEISHMGDVKSVFSHFFIFAIVLVILIIIVLLLIFHFDKKRFISTLSGIFKKSSLLSLFYLMLIFISSLFSFDSFFTIFHRIFFKGSTWLFAATDNIINIYPFELFSDLMSLIVFHIILFIFVQYLLGILLSLGIKKSKK